MVPRRIGVSARAVRSCSSWIDLVICANPRALILGSVPETELLSTLQRYWGYSSFRPLQEQVVKSLLAGRDACVVMPTGGGKSLCYQLPAAMTPGRTAIVVSPLIALMQDQVAQLEQMGVSAAVCSRAQNNAQQ